MLDPLLLWVLKLYTHFLVFGHSLQGSWDFDILHCPLHTVHGVHHLHQFTKISFSNLHMQGRKHPHSTGGASPYTQHVPSVLTVITPDDLRMS